MFGSFEMFLFKKVLLEVNIWQICFLYVNFWMYSAACTVLLFLFEWLRKILQIGSPVIHLVAFFFKKSDKTTSFGHILSLMDFLTNLYSFLFSMP